MGQVCGCDLHSIKCVSSFESRIFGSWVLLTSPRCYISSIDMLSDLNIGCTFHEKCHLSVWFLCSLVLVSHCNIVISLAKKGMLKQKLFSVGFIWCKSFFWSHPVLCIYVCVFLCSVSVCVFVCGFSLSKSSHFKNYRLQCR